MTESQMIDKIVSDLQEILDSCESRYDKMTDSAQESDRGALLQKKIEQIQEALDSLEGIR